MRGVKLVKGFNSDISHDGRQFHIQTEDWGLKNPYLVSRVFQHGQVLKSVKLSYGDLLPKEADINETSIRLAMSEQHHHIIDLLLSDKLF